MLDTLDVRIVRAFFQNQALSPLSPDFRESVASIARKVGGDEDTVRHRLKKIQGSGFIAEWRLFLNPSVFGGGELSVAVDVDPSSPKADLVEQLRLVPGVIFVSVCYDSLVACIDYENELSLPRTVELVRRLSGAQTPWVRRNAFPACRAVFRARDWDLIRALRRNPLKPCADLGAELGLSSRTTRSRLEKIAAEQVMFAWPFLNLRAVSGGVFTHLNVEYPRERKAEIDESIMAHVEPYFWHVLHMLPYLRGDLWACGYDLIVPSLSEAREILDWTKGVLGVENARLYLYEEIVNFPDKYDELLARRLSRMPTAIRAVPVSERPDRVAPPEAV